MSELVADCPRCGTKAITLDLSKDNYRRTEYNWQKWYEAFAICRACHKGTIYVLALHKHPGSNATAPSPAEVKGAANDWYNVEDYVSLKDAAATPPPEHLPEIITKVFAEGATCLATKSWNAAGTMFRLCVDLATREMLPPEGSEGGPNSKQRRDLGLRLPWLFDRGLLPPTLRELSTSIKEDGNDGAHQGTLTRAEAEDMLDFTTTLLERLYTEPARVRIAQERREARRGGKA